MMNKAKGKLQIRLEIGYADCNEACRDRLGGGSHPHLEKSLVEQATHKVELVLSKRRLQSVTTKRARGQFSSCRIICCYRHEVSEGVAAT